MVYIYFQFKVGAGKGRLRHLTEELEGQRAGAVEAADARHQQVSELQGKNVDKRNKVCVCVLCFVVVRYAFCWDMF